MRPSGFSTYCGLESNDPMLIAFGGLPGTGLSLLQDRDLQESIKGKDLVCYINIHSFYAFATI
jgi:hypothetical protein